MGDDDHKHKYGVAWEMYAARMVGPASSAERTQNVESSFENNLCEDCRLSMKNY